MRVFRRRGERISRGIQLHARPAHRVPFGHLSLPRVSLACSPLVSRDVCPRDARSPPDLLLADHMSQRRRCSCFRRRFPGSRSQTSRQRVQRQMNDTLRFHSPAFICSSQHMHATRRLPFAHHSSLFSPEIQVRDNSSVKERTTWEEGRRREAQDDEEGATAAAAAHELHMIVPRMTYAGTRMEERGTLAPGEWEERERREGKHTRDADER